MEQKYLIDTEENKMFLKEIRENLLNFGHRFPAPDGTCYYLGDDGTPWKICLMSIQSGNIWDMKAAKN